MNLIKSPHKLIKNINMQHVILPLRVVAGLSALVFVLDFSYEILISNSLQVRQKWALSTVIFILSVWANLELRPALKSIHSAIILRLQYLLLLQLGVAILRPVIGLFIDAKISQNWVLLYGIDIGWRWVFLIVYSILFIAIMDSIINLFALNEKNKAQALEDQMLASLNSLAMARDNETGNHIIRTQNYVKKLALRLREMGHYKDELSDEMIENLFKAAPLHDIGKVGIPDHILHKQGRLNDEEWQVMKTHASIGEAVLSSAESELQDNEGVIRKAFKIAGGHHEKWDGTGYPRRLKGEEIPLPARIMALADVYDALVSERVYKAGWSHQDAVNEIASKRGSHFDPLLVDDFLFEQANFQEIANQFRDH
jgi:HD-GYP domain-containing protein (c-di-GMP phosphodiesterase class II)